MSPLILVLLSLLSSSLLLPSSAAEVRQSDDPTPVQERIALLPGGMTVSWSTVGPLTTDPSVVYGLSPDQLTGSASGWSSHYDPSLTTFHHVPLPGLTAATRYYWKVASPPTVNSSVLSFTTAPKVGSATPFSVAINGDMGYKAEAATLAVMKQWVQDGVVDWFYHIGDLNYADDWEIELSTYEKITEQWMTLQQGVWTEKAYQVLPGNHEATCSEVTPRLCYDGQRNFTSFLLRYYMAAEASGAVNNMYYSFEYGQVHFISIDTEVDFPQSPEGPGTRLSSGPFGDQLTWLEADLKKAVANRAKVPWIIVGGHRPYYSSCGDITGSVQAAFEPLFLQYQVDVVFLGHIHWYERLYPTGANGTVQQQGYEDAEAPIYIVSASAGNVEGLSCPKLQPKDAKPFTAFFNGAAYGLGLLSVHNATNLEWAFYESAGGTMIDRVDIVKAKRWEQLQREAVVKPTPGAARLRAE